MTAAPATHLLYLHGFRSSPQSTKARLTAAWVRQHRPEVHWWCPQLPASPRDAMALIDAGTRDWPAAASAVIGSSLGGFYAAAHAARRGWRAVLLNPAVHPARDLASHVGATTAWHDDAPFEFRPEFVDALREIEAAAPARLERCLAVIAKGDEVLDWREMAQRCAGCRTTLIEGGDHALGDYPDHLGEIAAFLGLD